MSSLPWSVAPPSADLPYNVSKPLIQGSPSANLTLPPSTATVSWSTIFNLLLNSNFWGQKKSWITQLIFLGPVSQAMCWPAYKNAVARPGPISCAWGRGGVTVQPSSSSSLEAGGVSSNTSMLSKNKKQERKTYNPTLYICQVFFSVYFAWLSIYIQYSLEVMSKHFHIIATLLYLFNNYIAFLHSAGWWGTDCLTNPLWTWTSFPNSYDYTQPTTLRIFPGMYKMASWTNY